jgi:hypothetical protein
MAIAIQNTYSNSRAAGGSGTLTVSGVAATGSSCIAVVAVGVNYGGDNISGVTYDGSAMTKVISTQPTVDQPNTAIYWKAVAAGSGKDVVVSYSAGDDRAMAATVYILTGAHTTSQADNSGRGGNAGSAPSQSLTPTEDNCIVIDSISTTSTAANTVSGSNTEVYDAQGMYTSYIIQTTAGLATLSWTNSKQWGGTVASFKAAAASGPANVKTVKGLAIASVKTMNGLAIASVKTIKGLN